MPQDNAPTSQHPARMRAPEKEADRAPVGHLLRRVYHRARDTSSALYRAYDITPEQAAALFAIRRAGSLSQARIGEAIAMEPANVSGLVRRLTAKSLIVAERDAADPRRLRIQLTPHGQTIADTLRALASRSEAKTLDALSKTERATLVALLRKMLLAGDGD